MTHLAGQGRSLRSSMDFTEHGIIIKVGLFREYDQWVRLLTPTKGILTAFAFGGSRSRRRFGGCLDALSNILFTARTSRNGAYIQMEEGTLLNGFSRLKADLPRLGMAVNCVKFLTAFQTGVDNSRVVYDLTLATLAALDELEEIQDFWPLFFRAKVAFESGFAPDFKACHLCGKDIEHIASPFFCIEKGGVSCQACRPPMGLALPTSRGTLRLLSRLQDTGPREWRNLRMVSEIRSECYELVDRYVQYHLGLRQDERGFRRG